MHQNIGDGICSVMLDIIRTVGVECAKTGNGGYISGPKGQK